MSNTRMTKEDWNTIMPDISGKVIRLKTIENILKKHNIEANPEEVFRVIETGPLKDYCVATGKVKVRNVI